VIRAVDPRGVVFPVLAWLPRFAVIADPAFSPTGAMLAFHGLVDVNDYAGVYVRGRSDRDRDA
jgi:hypothetical protein